MGAVPKKKQTRSRSNKRRNAPSKRLSLPNLTKCPSCGKLRQSHHACPHCHTYGSQSQKVK